MPAKTDPLVDELKRPRRSRFSGLYAPLYRRGDPRALEQCAGSGLAQEIDLLRVVMRRVADQAVQRELSLEEWLDLLEALGAAGTRLARLLQTQESLGSGEESLQERAMREALQNVTRKLGIGAEDG